MLVVEVGTVVVVMVVLVIEVVVVAVTRVKVEDCVIISSSFSDEGITSSADPYNSLD
tara:strand:+ start:887 stop:1057 length:171 start_codon:yes stop_codon:yes gene_type:complete